MKYLFYIASLVFIFGCSEILMDEDNNAGIKYDDFETTWLLADSIYPYFEYKKINWDSLHTVYREKIENTKGDEYFDVLFNLLCELKDGHVGLQLPNGEYLSKETPRQIKDRDAFNLNITIENLDNNYSLSGEGKIGYATIDKDFGYIHVGTLKDWDSRWIYEIDEILENFSQTKGLILDVRHNDGGSSKNGDYIISHFLERDLQTPGAYLNNEFHDGIVLSPQKPHYSNLTILLVNGRCFSSTEHFIMNMQQIQNVVVIGDTTGGGSGNPAYYNLPSGLKVRLSRVHYLQYNQTPIEWNGIVPDILIPQTKEDIMNKRDRQLEYAIKYLEEQNLVLDSLDY